MVNYATQRRSRRGKVVHRTKHVDIITPLPTVPSGKPVRSNGKRYIADILTDGMWEGRRCFIFGGGPSLHNFDYTKFTNELTIGTNKTILNFYPTINYSMDVTFFKYITSQDCVDEEQKIAQERWKNYNGIRAFMDQGLSKSNNTIYSVPKLNTRTISFSLEQGIYPGNNSGFGALILAIALKANPIYLLGFDMKIRENKTHCHGGYPKQDIIRLKKRFSRYIRLFTKFQPTFVELGYNVINCCIDSAIECFEKKPIEKVMLMECEQTAKPIITAFYTDDGLYKKHAERLIESCKKFNLEYDILIVEDRGSWDLNTKYKPSILRHMLYKHHPKPVVLVDADAIFVKDPTWFTSYKGDFAVHAVNWKEHGVKRRRSPELLSGTIIARNTDRVINLINQWEAGCIDSSSNWEQRVLQDIIGEGFDNLPAEYCCIYDTMSSFVPDPVVLHMQASREVRKLKR